MQVSSDIKEIKFDYSRVFWTKWASSCYYFVLGESAVIANLVSVDLSYLSIQICACEYRQVL